MTSLGTEFPRVTIQFCTQCKWMLRAAYFAQELLSTFNTALGEVALQPSTGGTFIVSIYTSYETHPSGQDSVKVQRHILWDRKVEGGFPETKELKRRVRDIVEPGRDLGHVDGKKKRVAAADESTPAQDRENVETNESVAVSKEETKRDDGVHVQEAYAERKPQGHEHMSRRQSKPMIVDVAATVVGNGLDEDQKRNDCEDCI